MGETGTITFEPETYGTRVAYTEDGRRVSDLEVLDRWMWLGPARLHVGCIGGVGTSERARNRGLSRRVLQATVDWMATRYDLSMLFGIPDFYGRFGYSSCIPEHRVTLALRDIEGVRAPLRSRPYVAEDHARLLQLHAQRYAGSVGAFDRDDSWYEPQRRSSGYGRRAMIRFILGEDGLPAGYLILDDAAQQATVSEVVAGSAEAAETALALVAAAMRGRGVGTAELHLPQDDPFVVFVRRYGLSASTQYLHERGGMMRVCDLRSTLRRLLPDLAQRWPGVAAGLCLETDIGAVGLRRREGRLDLVEEPDPSGPRLVLPQGLLVTLMMGYRSVREVMSDPRCRADPVGLDVAQALFPRRTAFVPGPDRF